MTQPDEPTYSLSHIKNLVSKLDSTELSKVILVVRAQARLYNRIELSEIFSILYRKKSELR